jgi:hypothetical protein
LVFGGDDENILSLRCGPFSKSHMRFVGVFRGLSTHLPPNSTYGGRFDWSPQ